MLYFMSFEILQGILQGIASNLVDSNLFQLKSSTLWKTYRWVLVTWGFLPRHFQPSVGLVFWVYQTGSCMWVIGHLAKFFNMQPHRKPEYQTLISLDEAKQRLPY